MSPSTICRDGQRGRIITKLLDRYASESSHIKWETKDPAVYPTFAAQYGVQSAENGSLILVSGEKSAVLARPTSTIMTTPTTTPPAATV